MYFLQQYNQYLKFKSSIEVYSIDVNPRDEIAIRFIAKSSKSLINKKSGMVAMHNVFFLAVFAKPVYLVDSS